MERCVLIDYGSGNLRSAAKAFELAATVRRLEVSVQVSGDPAAMRAADRIVLPGVGAFADCRRGLEAIPGLIDALEERVRHDKKPFLGICVGMQLMAERGLEFETTPGLGWIKGDVVAIRPALPSQPSLKVPHMGWNDLRIVAPQHLVLADIPQGDHGYFVHSYHFACTDRSDVIATVDYGGEVVAVVGRENIVGTQFHPEKSQATGLRLLGNFLAWSP